MCACVCVALCPFQSPLYCQPDRVTGVPCPPPHLTPSCAVRPALCQPAVHSSAEVPPANRRYSAVIHKHVSALSAFNYTVLIDGGASPVSHCAVITAGARGMWRGFVAGRHDGNCNGLTESGEQRPAVPTTVSVSFLPAFCPPPNTDPELLEAHLLLHCILGAAHACLEGGVRLRLFAVSFQSVDL